MTDGGKGREGKRRGRGGEGEKDFLGGGRVGRGRGGEGEKKDVFLGVRGRGRIFVGGWG